MTGPWGAQPTIPIERITLDRQRRRPPFGRLIWPWRITTTELDRRAPLIALNRRPGQLIGIHFRLPDGAIGKHYGLSIRWGRPT